MKRLHTLGFVAVLALAGCPDDRLQTTLPPGALIDVFSQLSVNEVDVLFVIDNSGSMVEEQENLSRNLDRFLGFLADSQIDYHLAVTTTDTINDAGRLKGDPVVVTPATPDPLAAIRRNIKQPPKGNAREQGLDAARRTLELNPPAFLREKAWLFIIFLSDEEDSSEPGTPKFFYRYFEGLKGKGNENMVNAGAIIGPSPDGCINETGRAAAGKRYTEVVEKMGGRTGSICSPEFDVLLKEMGLDAVGLRRRFTLSRVVDPKTMEIRLHLPCGTAPEKVALCTTKVDTCDSNGDILCVPKPQGAGEVDGWTYDSNTNAIIFNGASIPPKGVQMEVQYFEQGKAPDDATDGGTP